MKKKFFIAASIIALGVILSGIGITKGYTQTDILEKLYNNSFENATEKVDVKSIFDADFSIAKKIIAQNSDFLPKEFRSNPEEYQPQSMGNPYKVYTVNKESFQAYKASGQFGSIISGEYLWKYLC